jgi:adenylate cyclase
VSEAGDRAFFQSIESHRGRLFLRVMRRLPADPRCAVCGAPYGGVGGRIMGRFGFAPSRKNPRLCSACFEQAPMGGVEMEVGILFADVRGFTSLAQRQSPDASATLLNRFYGAAVDVICRHAIIDKLVGLDVGEAFVGNIGERALFDFTAIGDVVNTAARLQAAAASGEIVISRRVHERAGERLGDATPRELSIKGKTAPEIAMVVRVD